MTRLPIVPVAVLLLSVVACTAMPPADVPPPMADGACNADPASWAIGHAATADVVERARVDSHSNDVRVVEPGQAVTMDYRGDRLNIDVNERGAITGLRCG